MPPPFCADQSHPQATRLIGTAPPTQCFVMIECPPPWGQTIQQAEHLPPTLRAMVTNPDYKRRGIRFFLISGDKTACPHRHFPAFPRQRMLIFQHPQGLAAGYEAAEFWVPTLEEAAIALQRYFAGEALPHRAKAVAARDLFICTHGQYNQCCGRYGYPFYQKAQQLAQQWDIPTLRLWQISHIGGHRFAPTLIDLPQGRYYGCLNPKSLTLLALQQGDWRSLLPHYRGWSLLPKHLQPLEHLLWQAKGWQWLAQPAYGSSSSSQIEPREA